MRDPTERQFVLGEELKTEPHPREQKTPSNEHLRKLISGLCQEVAQLWKQIIIIKQMVERLRKGDKT